jgi:replicative DNA helicase
MPTANRTNGNAQVTSEIIDRQPPRDLTAEAGVIGSILLLPDVLDDVALIVTDSDFYESSHAILFSRLLAMRASGKRIDSTLLLAALEKHGELDDIGGIGRLAELARSVPHAANAKFYSEIVRDMAAKRELIHAGSALMQMGYGSGGDVRELVSDAESRVFSIRNERLLGGTHTSDIGQVLMRAMDEISSRMDNNTPFGLPTGFADLDREVNLRNGNLIVLAARTSMGKTAFALNVARNVAETRPVLFFTMEMDNMLLADRLLAAEAQINIHAMRNGRISITDRSELVAAASRIAACNLDINDATDLDITEIAAVARRAKRRRKDDLGLIVVDYLQLIRPDDPKATREQQVSRMTVRLKGIAREMDCPVLCLAQLNRQAEAGGSRPRLSHLRESGAIEQDADVVMFIHREEYFCQTDVERDKVRGQAEVIIAKNRNGPTGTVPLVWQSQFTRFDNAAKQPAGAGDDWSR